MEKLRVDLNIKITDSIEITERITCRLQFASRNKRRTNTRGVFRGGGV